MVSKRSSEGGATGDDSDDDGVWPWLALGVILLAAVAGVVAVGRKR